MTKCMSVYGTFHKWKFDKGTQRRCSARVGDAERCAWSAGKVFFFLKALAGHG